jgi:hypothetical protein
MTLDEAAQAAQLENIGPWTCFHCGETFTDPVEAQAHFGEDQTGTTAMSEAACRIASSDGGLLKALRESEREVGSLRHQTDLLEYDATAYVMQSSELERYFGERTPRGAWLKLEAAQNRILALELRVTHYERMHNLPDDCCLRICE